MFAPTLLVSGYFFFFRSHATGGSYRSPFFPRAFPQLSCFFRNHFLNPRCSSGPAFFEKRLMLSAASDFLCRLFSFFSPRFHMLFPSLSVCFSFLPRQRRRPEPFFSVHQFLCSLLSTWPDCLSFSHRYSVFALSDTFTRRFHPVISSFSFCGSGFFVGRLASASFSQAFGESAVVFFV